MNDKQKHTHLYQRKKLNLDATHDAEAIRMHA